MSCYMQLPLTVAITFPTTLSIALTPPPHLHLLQVSSQPVLLRLAVRQLGLQLLHAALQLRNLGAGGMQLRLGLGLGGSGPLSLRV